MHIIHQHTLMTETLDATSDASLISLYHRASSIVSSSHTSSVHQAAVSLSNDDITNALACLWKVVHAIKIQLRNHIPIAKSTNTSTTLYDTRTFKNPYYLLCNALIDIAAIIHSKQKDNDGGDVCLCLVNDSLVYFPLCVHGLFMRAIYFKRQLKSANDLVLFESYLRRAVECQIGEDPYGLGGISEITREVSSRSSAQHALALHLCQESAETLEARQLLTELGFTYRLSPFVLQYDLSPTSKFTSNYSSYLQCIDNSLPDDMFTIMKDSFSLNSVFWQEHDYGQPSTGYFSYLHSIDSIHQPSNRLEHIIQYLYNICIKHYPEVKLARHAEWWTHCRRHSSFHQLHYDSDEPKFDLGKGPFHPIVSSVLYLSETGVGGPTLVTNQVIGGGLATKGWLSYPKPNRYCMFDGRYYHGVIPGRGPCNHAERRITFMAAFWKQKDFECQGNPGEFNKYPGPCQPFPSCEFAVSRYTWTLLFQNLNQPSSLQKRKRRNSSQIHSNDPAVECKSDICVAHPLPVPVWSQVALVLPPVTENMRNCPDYKLCFQF